MTTYNETVIAQNAAIISLLKDLLNRNDQTHPPLSALSENLIDVSNKAASGWLEKLQDDTNED